MQDIVPATDPVPVTGQLLEQISRQYGLQITPEQAVVLAAYLQRCNSGISVSTSLATTSRNCL